MEWFGLRMHTMCLKQSMGLESGGIASSDKINIASLEHTIGCTDYCICL